MYYLMFFADNRSILAWPTKETDPLRLLDNTCSFGVSTPAGVMHAKWDSHSWNCTLYAAWLKNILQISHVNGLYYHILAPVSEHSSLCGISDCWGFKFPPLVDGYWDVFLQMLPLAKLYYIVKYEWISSLNTGELNVSHLNFLIGFATEPDEHLMWCEA